MDIEQLFLERIQDLSSRMNDFAPYRMLDISGMLRQLIVDPQHLVAQVNRTYRMTLLFKLDSGSLKADGSSMGMRFIGGGLAMGDAEMAPPDSEQFVSLDQLLATVIAIHGPTEVTVLDVIKYYAHIGGSVHAGKPRDQHEREVGFLMDGAQRNEHSVGYAHLQQILNVVLDGLKPLAEAVRASRLTAVRKNAPKSTSR